MCAGIVNIRAEWPLSNTDLFNYATNKYGENLNEVKYYETKEIKDFKGRVVLEGGKRVNKEFKISYFENGEVKTNDLTKLGTNVVAIDDPVSAVSNYVHETRINNDKRNIFVLKNGFLQQFLDDFRDIMIYGPSSQFVDDKTVKTENTNLTMP